MKRKITVACYCKGSPYVIESQKDFFTTIIINEPKWNFCSDYSDYENSFDSAEEKQALFTMIEDAKQGKIDLIVTKSLSMFSTNLTETLAIVQELKGVGVGVLFYNDNLNSLDDQHEIVFTVLEELNNNKEGGLNHVRKKGDGNTSQSRCFKTTSGTKANNSCVLL